MYVCLGQVQPTGSEDVFDTDLHDSIELKAILFPSMVKSSKSLIIVMNFLGLINKSWLSDGW